MEDSSVAISIDENHRIRTLPDDQYRESEQLEMECASFIQKVQNFNGTIQSLVEILSAQADEIEKAKLQAMGQKLRVEMEAENRKRRQQQLKALIAEKTAELERLNVYYASLEKVEKEQRALIDKLSNNEA
ncbi:unnamed protein product [Vitrella brassicaformis CCMP3155]|uniref:Intraflagellar transport protein 20 n=1 Tax=Vitrella brassicaformis (strain CCMP3155) TaxID=1169540 RepID=A0A0G4EKF9_VITBC|nr:unnamed protein product [Vitrella brassicaformis CCMP3155]|mmetsp:Transcript_54037/g.135878  ORF Transcript_54037/g.135878 Transcript_54037/m.135878 type:complete len:131 (-) Transcript_54037:321-713(-)|eukprot:CEL97930.1 unnamed protein product [Vitrella brassicaformis CCMP3155]